MNKFYIQWHITRMCNMRCIHCYQDSFTGDGELGWEGLKEIADNLIDYLSRNRSKIVINITGGEPFLKEEFFQLLKYLNSSPAIEELMVISNGSLFNKDLNQRLSSVEKLSTIKISLEGLTESVNSRIRPTHSFHIVLDNLRELVKLNRFKILLMFTVCRKNFDQTEQLFDFCKDEDLDGFIIERFIPMGRGSKIKEEILRADDWKTLLNQLIIKCDAESEIDNLLPYKAFWITNNKDDSFELKGAPCIIGENGFCIMENADIYACRRLPIVVGNLLKKPLEDVINEGLLSESRNRSQLKGKCGICDISECHGCRALAYSLNNDIFAEDPQCWKTLKAS